MGTRNRSGNEQRKRITMIFDQRKWQGKLYRLQYEDNEKGLGWFKNEKTGCMDFKWKKVVIKQPQIEEIIPMDN